MLHNLTRHRAVSSEKVMVRMGHNSLLTARHMGHGRRDIRNPKSIEINIPREPSIQCPSPTDTAAQCPLGPVSYRGAMKQDHVPTAF